MDELTTTTKVRCPVKMSSVVPFVSHISIQARAAPLIVGADMITLEELLSQT